jgi:hypothetical protein
MPSRSSGTKASLLSVLLVLGVGCGCPKGNEVVASRDVSFGFQLVTAADTYAGHADSPPSGEAIAFDRATLTSSPDGPTAGADDLLLYALAPGCHADDTGAKICDWGFRIYVTIHGVGRLPNLPPAIAVGDTSAAVNVVGEPPPVPEPCPDKPELADVGGTCNISTPEAPVAYHGLAGQFVLTELAEDCTDVVSICALTAQGSFHLTAVGPNGEALSATDGALVAADSLMYRDTCTD